MLSETIRIVAKEETIKKPYRFTDKHLIRQRFLRLRYRIQRHGGLHATITS